MSAYGWQFMHEERLCIVMDLAEAGDLYDLIKSQRLLARRAARSSYFPEKSVLSWFIQLACGLKHCHDNKLLHRDIKSKNVLLFQNSRFPGGFVLKLGDFGLAKSVRTDQGNLARTTVGTPLNMSPELMQNQVYSFETDVWALGTVLHELCALQPPFMADSMRELRKLVIRSAPSEIPAQFSHTMRKLIATMLHKKRERRPKIDDVLRLPHIRQALTDNLEAQRAVRIHSSSSCSSSSSSLPPTCACLSWRHDCSISVFVCLPVLAARGSLRTASSVGGPAATRYRY